MPSTVSATSSRVVMRTVRPHGGTFRVGRDGAIVTMVGKIPTYVTTVTANDWFPEA